VQVPRDEEGRPRFSISQFRRYGAADLRLLGAEVAKGCPAQYHAVYVTKDVPDGEPAANLALGTAVHDALHRMERDQVSPQTALELAWPVTLDESHWPVAIEMLESYLARGGPMTRFATLDHELDLSAELYVDEDFGPVMFRGIVDYIGLDLDAPELLHGVDYKSNIQPPTRAQVQGDSQLKGYHWLLAQNWHRWFPKGSSPRIVMHLDALRYKDVDIRYNPEEMDQWHGWAVAVARKILRDETAEPHLNDGCPYCPIKHRCPKWLGLPGVAKSLQMRATGETPEELWARRAEFAQVAKLAAAEVKSIDEKLKSELNANDGQLEFGDQRWRYDSGWEDDVDWPRLQEILGPAFFLAVSTSKAAITRATAGLPPSTRAMALAQIRQRPAGLKVVKETRAAG
jgi:PD-(D/E)XK nuclease superfamily protein